MSATSRRRRTSPETVVYAADLVVLARDPAGHRHVLLVERPTPPDAGAWALPGGPVAAHETAAATAVRALAEQTGLDLLLTQPRSGMSLIGVYDQPGRDPRGRVVSAAYLAVLDTPPPPVTGDTAAVAARWAPVLAQPRAIGLVLADDRTRLAFDHEQILRNALTPAH